MEPCACVPSPFRRSSVQRILMPLCGGMCWEVGFFSWIGHQVVGVEAAPKAVTFLGRMVHCAESGHQ